MKLETVNDLRILLKESGGKIKIGELVIREEEDIDVSISGYFIGWISRGNSGSIPLETVLFNLAESGIKNFAGSLTPPEDSVPDTVEATVHQAQILEKDKEIANLKGQLTTFVALLGKMSEINLK